MLDAIGSDSWRRSWVIGEGRGEFREDRERWCRDERELLCVFKAPRALAREAVLAARGVQRPLRTARCNSLHCPVSPRWPFPLLSPRRSQRKGACWGASSGASLRPVPLHGAGRSAATRWSLARSLLRPAAGISGYGARRDVQRGDPRARGRAGAHRPPDTRARGGGLPRLGRCGRELSGT